jgi:hypothetical protein
MLKNVAPWDRAMRIIIGLGLITLAVVARNARWGWAGLIPLATGISGTCPLYRVLGISSCSTSKPPSDPALPG